VSVAKDGKRAMAICYDDPEMGSLNQPSGSVEGAAETPAE
jgi:hypothetical protein